MHKAGQPWQAVMDNGSAEATHLPALHLREPGNSEDWILASVAYSISIMTMPAALGDSGEVLTGEDSLIIARLWCFLTVVGGRKWWGWELCDHLVFLVRAQPGAGSGLPTAVRAGGGQSEIGTLMLILHPLAVFTFHVDQIRSGREGQQHSSSVRLVTVVSVGKNQDPI